MRADVLVFALLGCGSRAAEPVPGPGWGPAIRVGTLKDADLIEVSGLADGRGGLWGVSDSGNAARLVRIGPDGAVTGRFDVGGAENVDWEALSSFVRDERTWLLVGDVGDNGAWREAVTLYVVEEPAADATDGVLPVAWSIGVAYPDGARDTEAIAVDGDQVLLVTKRTEPPEVWSVPLSPSAHAVASRVGTIPSLPPSKGMFGRSRPARPTDLAVARDGRLAVVMTYDEAYAWTRGPTEDWATTFGRAPVAVGIPRMDQPEALCLGADGRALYATSEGAGAPLYRVDLLPGAP